MVNVDDMRDYGRCCRCKEIRRISDLAGLSVDDSGRVDATSGYCARIAECDSDQPRHKLKETIGRIEHSQDRNCSD